MILLLLLLMGFLPPGDHAFYVSVIEVRHIDQVPSATITVKVFSDDLQTALRQARGDVDPALANLCLTEADAIRSYFAEHLQVKINDQLLSLTHTSCGFEGDAHQIQFTAGCPEQWSHLEIHADYFMEVYPTQMQMVHINEHGENYTLRLSKSRPLKQVTFR
ncbi:MAG: DUF6702 family protein [Saprospiraceae bacterium]|nr:DUF6702 family protein [Saprospiraceae bacterium]